MNEKVKVNKKFLPAKTKVMIESIDRIKERANNKIRVKHQFRSTHRSFKDIISNVGKIFNVKEGYSNNTLTMHESLVRTKIYPPVITSINEGILRLQQL